MTGVPGCETVMEDEAARRPGSFTSAFAVALLEAEYHRHGPGGGTWVRYDDAVRIAHEVWKRRQPKPLSEMSPEERALWEFETGEFETGAPWQAPGSPVLKRDGGPPA